MPKWRLAGPMAAGLLCLGIGGCTTTSSDPASLIPQQIQASVMAEDRLLGPKTGASISVDEMLERARQAGGSQTTPSQGQAAPGAVADATAPGAPATGAAPTGAAAPAAPAAKPPARPASPPAPAEPPQPKALFEITFDGTEDQPAAAVRDALAKKIKTAKVGAKQEVTILAGPGGGTTAFDQAMLANKRARAVRSLLPEGWTINQVYDPTFPPDTVRLVLGRTD